MHRTLRLGALAVFGTGIVAALSFLASTSSTLAHGGGSTNGDLGALLGGWSAEPSAIVLLVALAASYSWAYRRLRRTAPRFRFSAWRAVAFGAGIIVLLFALVSPIDTYGDDLFISHMLQHVLVMMVVAPLLILGKPVTLGLRAASPAIRRRYLLPTLRSRALNLLLRPQIVLALFVSTIWLWHIPDLYDAAIANDALHSLEHFSFLAASLLFWWLIIDADPTPLRPGHPVRAVMLIVAIIQGIVLGSVITSLGEPIYETYEAAAVARDWGPSALSDQRTGAGLVWIPSGLVFVLALLITFQAWLDRMERETEQEDMVRRLRSERASYFEGEALAPPRRPN